MNKTRSDNDLESFTQLYEDKLPHNISWCSDETNSSNFEFLSVQSSVESTGFSTPNEFVSMKTNYSFSTLDVLLYSEYDPYKTHNMKQLSDLYTETLSLSLIQKESDILRTRLNTILTINTCYNSEKSRLEKLKSNILTLKNKKVQMMSKIHDQTIRNERERERLRTVAKKLRTGQYNLMKNWNNNREKHRSITAIQTIRLHKINKAMDLMLKWWQPTILHWFGLRCSSITTNKYRFSCIKDLIPSNIYTITNHNVFQLVFDMVIMILSIYANTMNIPLLYTFSRSRKTGGLILGKNGSENKYDVSLEESKTFVVKHLICIIDYLRFQMGNSAKINHKDILKNVIDLVQTKR